MAANGSATKPGARTATVNLPFVTAQFRAPQVHLPRVHVPNRQEINHAARFVGSYLPSPRKALYYGGLALAAAVELIEWPVAAAIAVGTAVAGSGESRETSQQTTKQQAPAKGSATRAAARGAKH